MAPLLPQPLQSFWLPETKAAVRVILPEYALASVQSSLSKRSTAPSIPYSNKVTLEDQQQHHPQMFLVKRDQICSRDSSGGVFRCSTGWYCSGPMTCRRETWYSRRWWLLTIAGIVLVLVALYFLRRLLVSKRNATASQTVYPDSTNPGLNETMTPQYPPPAMAPPPPAPYLYGGYPAHDYNASNIPMTPMTGPPQGQKPFGNEHVPYVYPPPKEPPSTYPAFPSYPATGPMGAGASSSSSASPPEYTPPAHYPGGAPTPSKS